MQSATKQKYLGDILSSDCKIDDNIKMRYDKGISICSQLYNEPTERSSFLDLFFSNGTYHEICYATKWHSFQFRSVAEYEQKSQPPPIFGPK